MRILKYISFLLMCVVLTGCTGKEDRMKIVFLNSSESEVFIYSRSDMSASPPTNSIPPGGNFSFYRSEENFEHGNFAVYVFKAETLEKNTWDYLKENNLFDAQYDLILNQLQNLNRLVVYPLL
ncbi:MAG: hypothetical protein V4581_17405 [Bacteroidota bacterium]